MKKIIGFYTVLALVAFVFSAQALADVVTTRKVQPKQHSVQQNTSQYQGRSRVAKSKNLSTQLTLEKKIISCSPYSESQTFDVGGVNFMFNIHIAGWVNNKCRLDFESQMKEIASSFSSIYGFDASQASEISAFTPKVRCEFSKQQLKEFGDLLLQENERREGVTNNMLKNPADIEILSKTQLSNSDQKLFDMLMNTSTCQMIGNEDLNSVINSIFGF